MKVLIAIDSFKGSLSSWELALAAEEGIKAIFPKAETLKFPLADGGEGTVEAMVKGAEGQIVHCTTEGPMGTSLKAVYGLLDGGRTAVIEMAQASGLPLVPADKRNPMKASTYGTGLQIKSALEKGCRNFIIGLGGSATNDGGTGMLQALGWKFLDKNGQVLGKGGEILPLIENIDESEALPALKDCTFLAACDVKNPFYGPQGAAYIFGPQKGADPDMVQKLDGGLKHFAEIITLSGNPNIALAEGAGAAGGLGGALMAFLGAKLQPGIGIILERLHFMDALDGADFVLTGEGRIDGQTLMGKAPSGVAQEACKKMVPVIALAGSLPDDAGLAHSSGIGALFSITGYPISLQEALQPKRAHFWVRRCTEEIFRLIKLSVH